MKISKQRLTEIIREELLMEKDKEGKRRQKVTKNK